MYRSEARGNLYSHEDEVRYLGKSRGGNGPTRYLSKKGRKALTTYFQVDEIPYTVPNQSSVSDIKGRNKQAGIFPGRGNDYMIV